MTLPYERSLAVLWAGGFLVELNGDRRVPLEHRRTAAHIARHFPTLEDVGAMSRISRSDVDAGMFEHPDHCGDWRKGCRNGPLTYSTRLQKPTAEDNPQLGPDDASSKDMCLGDLPALTRLAHAQVAADEARLALHRQEAEVHQLCLAVLPGLDKYFEVLGWDQATSSNWLQSSHFDDAPIGAQMIIDGRGQELLGWLQQQVDARSGWNPSGNPASW